MRLAISNIAWLPAEQAAAYALLKELGVRGLEIAPGMLFAGLPDPFDPGAEAIEAVRREMAAAGLSLVSMQSLLFGAEGMALFGDAAASEAFAAGIGRAIALAGRLGIPNLVVGSPKNRLIPDGMDRAAAAAHAAEVFRRLGDRAASQGCVLAMEPNPVAYGTNFLNTMEEAGRFVELVGHPAVRLNFDVGSLYLNGEFDDLPRLLSLVRPHISHVHVSEPHLTPVPADPAALRTLFAALAAARWDGWVSVEMRGGPEGNLARARVALEACLAAIKESAA